MRLLTSTRKFLGCSTNQSLLVPRFFLARVSPLLADTVKVGEGGQVRASVSPDGMRLPSDAYTIRVDPLRLTLGRGVLLDRLVTLLQAGQVSILLLSTSPVFTDQSKHGCCWCLLHQNTKLLKANHRPFLVESV